jgi:transcription factor RLM1
MENGLLPSPSSFYPDWPFGGRDGGSSAGGTGTGNMLPSPLTFQTPVNVHGPSFRDEDRADAQKRKMEGGQQEAQKKIKT